jgi:hypothetical protein
MNTFFEAIGMPTQITERGIQINSESYQRIPLGAVIRGVWGLLNDPNASRINGLIAYKHLAVWTPPVRCLVAEVGFWLKEITGTPTVGEAGFGFGTNSGDLAPAIPLDNLSVVDDVMMLPTAGIWRMVQAGQPINAEITVASDASLMVLQPLIFGIALY